MKLLITLLLMTFLHAAFSQQTDTIPFTWLGKYDAMLIAGSGMQFDLGSPRTDSATHTIGTDFIKDRVLVIDFPNRRLILCDQAPAAYSALHPMQVIMGRLLLPAQLNDKPGLFIYDSGSSAFGLITDSATAAFLSQPAAKAISREHNSWGRMLHSTTYSTRAAITLAGKSIPLQTVSWISGASAQQVDQMRSLGISGMLGNLAFLNNILVLDLKTKRFGIF
jgi:hypothetical protein